MLMAMDGGGASFAIGDKVLKFEPETVAATIARFDEIRSVLAQSANLSHDDLAGQPAAADPVSALARNNLATSADMAREALTGGMTQMFEVSETLRSNAASYGASDVIPPG
ncbi:hypothetical protein GCM10027047_35400 [Rhodococcus aerolatus]